VTPIRIMLLAAGLSLAAACVQQPESSALSGHSAGYDRLAAAQIAANSQKGPRSAPAHVIPVPTAEVSPELQAVIAAPYPQGFNVDPKTPAEWKEWVATRAQANIARLPAMKQKLGVSVESVTIAGVHAFIVTPSKIPPANRHRLLVHVHGGGYVLGPGEAGLAEAVLMSGFGGFKVISVDYRMPPDFPYPAAMDDAMAVYKAALKMAPAKNIAIFGTSTGGGMTLAMVLRAKAEKLPLPGAIAPGTPWSDLAKIGDSYETNEWVDNVLVTWDGWLGHAAKLYANGRDLKDPQLSPIYGDYHGFPPTILTTGTRDLFLSLTVRTHRKLLRAGAIADLQVYDGMSHAQYNAGPDVPETKEAYMTIAKFFDRHLGGTVPLRAQPAKVQGQP
jgi:epsilon-lactone hydrolase